MLRTFAMLPMIVFASAAFAHDPARTDGEKYKVRFENERVRVLEYRDQPGDRTHQHRHAAFTLYAVAHSSGSSRFPTARSWSVNSRRVI